MKVLMQTRQNVFDLAGGDTTQLVKTKEALESKGIDVDLSLDLRPDVSGYDVVHLFNLTRVGVRTESWTVKRSGLVEWEG